MKIYRSLPVILLVLSFRIFGQEVSPGLSLNESSIEDQFKYVYQKSSDYEEFKMIKRWYFNQLKSHVVDTLNLMNSMLEAGKNQIAAREASIDSLISLNTQVNEKLQKTEEEKNSIPFMGMIIQKTAYNSILWTIIAGLTGGLFIFIFLFRRSNTVTLQFKNDLGELKTEFEAFRKRALEREESVVRKYHDELMKYKSKSGKLN